MKKRVLIAGEAGCFRRYGEAVRNAGGEAVFQATPADGVAAFSFLIAETCDALLLPGGGDIAPWRYGQRNTASRDLEPERDAREWELLRAFTEAEKPVLGICRGMQSINVFFGGTLAQDIPGHSQLRGADRMHGVRTAPGPFAALFGTGRVMVNSAHHQAADRLGEGLRAEQWAEDGVIEALRHERLPVWGVQWHPERLPGAAGKELFRAFLSAIP